MPPAILLKFWGQSQIGLGAAGKRSRTFLTRIFFASCPDCYQVMWKRAQNVTILCANCLRALNLFFAETFKTAPGGLVAAGKRMVSRLEARSARTVRISIHKDGNLNFQNQWFLSVLHCHSVEIGVVSVQYCHQKCEMSHKTNGIHSWSPETLQSIPVLSSWNHRMTDLRILKWIFEFRHNLTLMGSKPPGNLRKHLEVFQYNP